MDRDYFNDITLTSYDAVYDPPVDDVEYGDFECTCSVPQEYYDALRQELICTYCGGYIDIEECFV